MRCLWKDASLSSNRITRRNFHLRRLSNPRKLFVICRYCSKPIEAGREVKTLAYWNQTPDICHVECKQPGEKQEALDCQTIDADCNDCIFFQRGEVVKKLLSAIVDGKPTMVLTNMGCVTGYCSLFDGATMAYPHQWTGRQCFHHRRAPAAPSKI